MIQESWAEKVMKMMKKNKNFSTTDGYKSTYNFLLLFHVKQHELMKIFGTDHKDYFYQKKKTNGRHWESTKQQVCKWFPCIAMYNSLLVYRIQGIILFC